MTKRETCLACLAGLALTVTTSRAFAQNAVVNPLRTPDVGVPLGSEASLGAAYIPTQQAPSAKTGARLSESSVLHLGVTAEAGIDTNVFYSNVQKVDSPVTRIIPFLQITNARPGNVTPDGAYYNLGASLVYREYLTDNSDVKAQRAFNPTVNGRVEFGSRQTLTFGLADNYARIEEAPYSPGTDSITRNFNQAIADLRWSPGGQRLTGTLRYTNSLEAFEDPAYKYANYDSNDLTLDVAWKWLPKTALFGQLSQGYVYYYNKDDPDRPTGAAPKSNGLPFRALLGLRGLVTEKLAATIGAGYNNTFFLDGAANPSGIGNLAAMAEALYRPTTLTQLVLGYRHEARNSVVGNFYDVDAVYTAARASILSRFVASAFGRYENRRYHGETVGLVGEVSVNHRRDNIFQAGLTADYFVQDWFFAGVFYVFTANRTSFTDVGPAASALEAPYQYDKSLLLGHVGVTY